jgi:hypothetical protein
MRLTNNKLNKNIIARLMQPTLSIPVEASPGEFNVIQNVTGIELDLLLYLSLIQDQFGNIKGLYYKDVCKELDCCKQSFYNALKGLELKEYILINFNYKEQKYWDLTILDNVFACENDDKKSYLNTNRKLFYTKEFRGLKVNEKKLLVYIALIYKGEKGLTFYPATVAKWLGIKSITLAWDYLKSISTICPFLVMPGSHGDKIKIEANNFNITGLNVNSERENFLTHRLKYLCKKRNIEFTDIDIKDLIILLGQKTAAAGIGKVISVICYVLDTYRSIQAKLINKLLTADSGTGEYPLLYT